MPWYDGTTNYNNPWLIEWFPVAVCDDLRFTGDGKRMAVTNDFPRGTALYDLADPKVEEDEEGTHMFCHVFLGEDAVVAGRAIGAFVSTADLKDGRSVMLFRKEPDCLLSYGYGYICTSLLHEQEHLRSLLPEDAAGEENVFILPLKRFMFRCPVCGHRMLTRRGAFEICGECGWEDEGIDDEDKEPSFGANGDYTSRTYREEYLQLKAENPDYKWSAADR